MLARPEAIEATTRAPRLACTSRAAIAGGGEDEGRLLARALARHRHSRLAGGVDGDAGGNRARRPGTIRLRAHQRCAMLDLADAGGGGHLDSDDRALPAQPAP
jgi:hypothetical protein